jgi:hypothetical protein
LKVVFGTFQHVSRRQIRLMLRLSRGGQMSRIVPEMPLRRRGHARVRRRSSELCHFGACFTV